MIGAEITLAEVQDRAKRLVMDSLVALAEQDGVPPTLRAMYVRKAGQAELVMAGGSSFLIEGEAAERGITPIEMAQLVLSMAAQAGDAAEVFRMKINIAIERAEDENEVIKILDDLGITFVMGSTDTVVSS